MQFNKRTASATTSTPLGSTLTALGFNARPGLYQRLFAVHDAVPLLHAVASTFDPHCVLSASEVVRYAHLSHGRHDPSIADEQEEGREEAPQPANNNTPLSPPPLLPRDDALALVQAIRLDFEPDNRHLHLHEQQPDTKGRHRHASDDYSETKANENSNDDHDGETSSSPSSAMVSALRTRLDCVQRQIDVFEELELGVDSNDDDNPSGRHDHYTHFDPNLIDVDDDDDTITAGASITDHRNDFNEEEEEDEDLIEEEYDPVDDVIALRDELTNLLYAVDPMSPRGSNAVAPYVAAERAALEQVLGLARANITRNEIRSSTSAPTSGLDVEFYTERRRDVNGNGSGEADGVDERGDTTKQQQQQQREAEDALQTQAALIDSYARLRAQTVQQRAWLLRIEAGSGPIRNNVRSTNHHHQHHQQQHQYQKYPYPSSSGSMSSSSSGVSYGTNTSTGSVSSFSPTSRQRQALKMQFDNRCAKVMDLVEARARVNLSDAVASVRAHGLHKRFDRIAKHLSITVSRLVEQRVRIMCVSAAQRRAAQARVQLYDALGVICSSCSSPQSAQGGQSDKGVKREDVEGESDGYGQQLRIHKNSNNNSNDNGNHDRRSDNALNHSSGDLVETESKYQPDPGSGKRNAPLRSSTNNSSSVEDVTATIDRESTVVMDTVFAEAAHVLDSFRSNVGCRRAWIDVDLDPGTASLIKRLDEELGANIKALEELVHILERLEQKP